MNKGCQTSNSRHLLHVTEVDLETADMIRSGGVDGVVYRLICVGNIKLSLYSKIGQHSYKS